VITRFSVSSSGNRAAPRVQFVREFSHSESGMRFRVVEEVRFHALESTTGTARCLAF
jgi:hypothetical protein